MHEKEIFTLQLLIFYFLGILCENGECFRNVQEYCCFSALLLFLHQIGFFMVAFLKNIRRRRRIQALEGSDIQAFPKVEELANVALVWRVESPDDVAQLDDVVSFFKSADLNSTILVVEHGKAFKSKQAKVDFMSLCEEKNAIFIPKEQIKWYGFPKSEIVRQLFKEMNFDMVISVCNVSDFTVEYLAAGLRSKFKAGMCESHWCSFSFVLEKGHAAPSVVEYLTTLFEYIRKMCQK